MTGVRDFIYLDLPRLRSIASQLLEGLPESRVATHGREDESAGELRAGLPVIGASANTREVLSAESTVTSTLHHRLVGLVLERLSAEDYLWPGEALEKAPDGSFAVLSGGLQVTDPTALRQIFEDWPTLQKQIATLGQDPTDPPAKPSRADRRAGRVNQTGLPGTYTAALAGVLAKFGEDNVRVRVLSGGRSVAVGVAERGKFVEDLGRLTARHGFVMTGPWEVLAQVNNSTEGTAYVPEGSGSLLDVIEATGLEPLRLVTGVSGTNIVEEHSVMITPLAVSRVISPRPG